MPAFTKDPKELSSFLSGAETGRVSKKLYPWEEPHVQASKHKTVFNLRLPEESYLKLCYIHEHTGGSKHDILINVVLELLDNETKRLQKEGHR